MTPTACIDAADRQLKALYVRMEACREAANNLDVAMAIADLEAAAMCAREAAVQILAAAHILRQHMTPGDKRP